MTTTTHIATAKLLSVLTLNPFVAFVIGFGSHAVLDVIEPQEYSVNLFSWGKDRGFIILEIILTLTLIALSFFNRIYLFAMLGAILPDLIDGIACIINPERYEKGEHIFPFHRPKQVKELTKLQTILLSTVLFLGVVL